LGQQGDDSGAESGQDLIPRRRGGALVFPVGAASLQPGAQEDADNHEHAAEYPGYQR